LIKVEKTTRLDELSSQNLLSDNAKKEQKFPKLVKGIPMGPPSYAISIFCVHLLTLNWLKMHESFIFNKSSSHFPPENAFFLFFTKQKTKKSSKLF